MCNENCFEPALELSSKNATKLKLELSTNIELQNVPLMEVSSLAEAIHVKARETSQNTNLDMPKFLGINKTLQSIKSELVNNT